MNGHGPPRTASTALGSPQASYVGRRSDSRIGRQSPLPPKPFNRQPSISTRRTRHPPEYSHSLDATSRRNTAICRVQPPIGYSRPQDTASAGIQLPAGHNPAHTSPHTTRHTHHQTPCTTPDATRRNPPHTTRHAQPGAHPHRTLRHTPPHPAKSQYLCNSAESQRFSDPSLNISPPKSDSASLSDSLPDIADERQSGIVGIPRISQSTHLTRPAAKSQYLVQTGVHHELLRHFSKKLSEIKPEREKLRPRHGTLPIGLAATSQPSPSGISQLTPKARRTTPAARGTKRAHVKRGRSSAAEPRGHHLRESGRAV